jgi:hypothetical protein
MCPGCGGEPLPLREGLDLSEMRCDDCGFSASGRDVTVADHLANFRSLPGTRVVAKRISDRSMLKYALTRVGNR